MGDGGTNGSRVLADYGANIIRIDSEARMDTARTLQPFRDDEALPDNSALYSNMNAGKRGLSLDLTKPEAIEVVHDLVQWADVVFGVVFTQRHGWVRVGLPVVTKTET